MSKTTDNLQMARTEGDTIAVHQPLVQPLRAAGRGAEDAAAQALFEQPGAGDMVGVHMGFERGGECQAEFAQQRDVALHMLEHRVDQHSLAAGGVGQQVGVGR